MLNSSYKNNSAEIKNGSDQSECGVEHIDAVIFDYGQVLSAPANPSAWAEMRVVSGLDEKRLHASYWKFRHDYDRGALNGTTYWESVATDAGVRFDDDQMAALRAADIDLWTDLNLPMVEWAGRLQRAGVRTGVLSNIGDSVGEGVINKMPWLAGFDFCMWSHALGTAKPDPRIYLKTAEGLDTAPSNILFIDDRAENIDGAASVGMQTLHYTTHADFEREMRERRLTYLLDAGIATK